MSALIDCRKPNHNDIHSISFLTLLEIVIRVGIADFTDFINKGMPCCRTAHTGLNIIECFVILSSDIHPILFLPFLVVLRRDAGQRTQLG